MGGRQRETSLYEVDSHGPPTRDLVRNSGVCPDRELNPRPFSSQASVQSTELPQPGQSNFKARTLLQRHSVLEVSSWNVYLLGLNLGRYGICHT